MSHDLGRNACISGLEESSFLLPCSQSLPRPQTGPTAEPASRLKFRSANPFLDYHLGAGPADQRFRDFVLVREQAAHVPRAGRVLGRSVETPKDRPEDVGPSKAGPNAISQNLNTPRHGDRKSSMGRYQINNTQSPPAGETA
ncbi:predicted protein [Chaetomium globosum CBS 148.51]|uniref:Uncharacterized protein n=1 Tax=Chaetomium globosum (strain ATCC 6205 / CBS 148.51 / DSM 1962 / NBRC 6347 / NRRL 1970) TaxID=306901 RepID=Q2GN71_CHAGB|nr:uncharacterized protein CHGG_10583 [Chaetomium globosum CBS 148.51]EAQ84179.1 predicted protein [Chaetomium globosum CBS 148.51]